MASVLDGFELQIRSLVNRGESHEDISAVLRQRLPASAGVSRRSFRRFCASRGIFYRSRLSDQQLDRIILAIVTSVGHSYGRRTIHGLLSAEGIHVSQRRVGRSLARVAPIPLQIRRHQAHRNLRPTLYTCIRSAFSDGGLFIITDPDCWVQKDSHNKLCRLRDVQSILYSPMEGEGSTPSVSKIWR